LASSRSVKILGLAPFAVLVTAMAILYVLDIHTAFEPPLLTPILYTVVFVICCVVSYISTKSYLRSGNLCLSLLSSGTLLLGISALISGWGIYLVGVNASVTVHNIGVLFSACVHFGSAILTYGWPSYHGALPFSLRNRAIMAWVGVIAFMVFLAVVSFQGLLPQFFLQGIGPTPLRQWVLGTAIALFILSAIVFMEIHFKTKSNVLYWYSLALALFGIGFFGVFLIKTVGCLLGWAGRGAQFAGGSYLLVAVLTTVRGSHTKEDKTGVAETLRRKK